MPKRDRAITSLLYLAHVLPSMRQHSEEAASLVEAAIIECVISMSGGEQASRNQPDLVAFLRYALDDVATITPTSVALLEQAISSLRDKRRNGLPEPSYVH